MQVRKGADVAAEKKPFISEDSRKILKKELENLINPVTILIFTSEGINAPFNDFSIKLFTELSRLSKKILPVFETTDSDLAKQYGIVDDIFNHRENK